MKTMEPFISLFKSAVIGTLDAQGAPFSSYAPFVYDGGVFYLYLSDIATHAQNLQARPVASLLFIEDECESENVFARKRLSLQCRAQVVARGSQQFEAILETFAQKFDGGMVGMLKSMADFNLYALKTGGGEATFGFGEAYTVTAEGALLPRRGVGHGAK